MNNKKNLIDGLPTSYDHNYVLKTNKKCFFCHKKIDSTDLELNSIICTEDFDFMHKDCVVKNNFEIVFVKPKDFTSMVKIRKQPAQSTEELYFSKTI